MHCVQGTLRQAFGPHAAPYTLNAEQKKRLTVAYQDSPYAQQQVCHGHAHFQGRISQAGRYLGQRRREQGMRQGVVGQQAQPLQDCAPHCR